MAKGRKKRPGNPPARKARTLSGKSATTGADGSKRQPGGPRVPSIVMVPVGLAVGWFVANWPGAIFGGLIGVFLWRSRA